MNEDGTIYAKGEDHHKAKLTEEDVIFIRQIHADYVEQRKKLLCMSPAALALKFDVSKQAIESVIYFKSWKHI
tara:strand:- start:271 stop:489 length:219 start_codon:yes stop_codon:yes gene_type:complete